MGVAFDWLYLYAANSVRLEFDGFPVGAGWFATESDTFGMTYRWMSATSSSIVLPLPADRSSAIEFRVLRAPTPEILNSLSLAVNGERIGLTYDNTTGDHLFRGVIPASAAGPADRAPATLTFQVESITSLKAVGEGNDTRGVGCAFDWLELRPVG